MHSEPGKRCALLLCAGLAVSLVGGAFLSTAVVAWADHHPGPWAQAILRKGPSTVARRTMTGLILLLLPWLLREAQWRGWRDAGWRPARGATRYAFFDAGLGILLGLSTLGAIMALQMWGGTRFLAPETGSGDPGRIAGLAFSAAMVALFEETLVRGVLFRSLSRVWGTGATAFVLSGLFSLGHFLRPSDAVFDNAFSPIRLLGSTLGAVADGVANAPVEAAMLFLMSGVLCLSVVRRGSIWMAVGLHAAWVWVRKMNGAWLNSSDVDGLLGWLLGSRPDGLDAALAIVMLTALAVGLARARPMSPRDAGPNDGQPAHGSGDEEAS